MRGAWLFNRGAGIGAASEMLAYWKESDRSSAFSILVKRTYAPIPKTVPRERVPVTRVLSFSDR